MMPAVASEQSIFSKNHYYKRVFRVAVNTCVPIFRGLDARGGRKLRTDTHPHADNHSNDNNKDYSKLIRIIIIYTCT